MRALLMVVVVACCGCASTGATPRPFPVPGPGPAETPEASRPNGGVSPTGTLPIRTEWLRNQRDGAVTPRQALPQRRGGPERIRLQRAGPLCLRAAWGRGAADGFGTGPAREGTSPAPSSRPGISCSSARPLKEPHTSASSSAVIHSYTRPHRTALSEWTDWARSTGRRATSARGGCSEL